MAKWIVDVATNILNSYEVEADSAEEARERYADVGLVIHSEAVGPQVQDVHLA